MKMKFLSSILILFFTLLPFAQAQASYCSNFDPSFCAALENEPVFDITNLSRFDLRLTTEVDSMSVEVAWYTQSEDFKITTVPQKITQQSETYYAVDGVLTPIDDICFVEIRAIRNGVNLFISIPITVHANQGNE